MVRVWAAHVTRRGVAVRRKVVLLIDDSMFPVFGEDQSLSSG